MFDIKLNYEAKKPKIFNHIYIHIHKGFIENYKYKYYKNEKNEKNEMISTLFIK